MMTEKSALDDIERPEEAEVPASPLRIALGFFILPMVMVIGAVGVFLVFGLIAYENKSVEEYLAEVTGGGINEPWQGAFGLANKLQEDGLQGDQALAGRIADALGHANAQNPDTRKFLILAIGRVGHPDSVPTLLEYLNDASPDVRANTLWALGNIGAAAAAQTPRIAESLRDEDNGVRGYTAYVLGTLGDERAVEPLEIALNDRTNAVRFNSAVALARLGNDAGVEELRRMIDRDYLAASGELNEQQQQDAMVAAIQAFAMLQAQDVQDDLIDLRDNDPDARVRDTARAALVSIYSTPRP